MVYRGLERPAAGFRCRDSVEAEGAAPPTAMQAAPEVRGASKFCEDSSRQRSTPGGGARDALRPAERRALGESALQPPRRRRHRVALFCMPADSTHVFLFYIKIGRCPIHISATLLARLAAEFQWASLLL